MLAGTAVAGLRVGSGCGGAWRNSKGERVYIPGPAARRRCASLLTLCAALTLRGTICLEEAQRPLPAQGRCTCTAGAGTGHRWVKSMPSELTLYCEKLDPSTPARDMGVP